METVRLPYIDKLKGLAMLLVVMGHTMYFCMYHEQRTTDPLLNIICTFHVPLFFFLSGFVVSTVPTPAKFLRKAYRFLMPMLIVGFINALLIGKVRDFFLNDGHNGYWYLLTLTFFYLLLMAFHAVDNLKGVVGFMADTALSVTIWLMLIFLMRFDDNVFLSALNLWGAFAYWPFFVIGFLCRKYSFLSFIPDRSSVIAIPVITYLVLLVSFFHRIDSLPILLDFFIAFIAIASLVLLFRKNSLNNSFIDRQLILIGNNTLSVYIYHYFFIRFIDLSLLTGENILVELLITSALTLAVTYATIAVGTIINRLLQCIKLS